MKTVFPLMVSPRLSVRCVLALTATATRSTKRSIRHHLQPSPCEDESISSSDWSLSPEDSLIPHTHHLSAFYADGVSKELHLVQLLTSGPFRSAKSIIVYCSYQVSDYIFLFFFFSTRLRFPKQTKE